MFDRTAAFTTQTADPQRRVRPIDTVTARNIAKAERNAGERASLAALWMLDRLMIAPKTAALAAAVFGCSESSVHRALAESREEAADMAELLAYHFRRATDDELAAYGRAVGPDAIWDRVIAPNI
jgi:hypothetical protein